MSEENKTWMDEFMEEYAKDWKRDMNFTQEGLTFNTKEVDQSKVTDMFRPVNQPEIDKFGHVTTEQMEKWKKEVEAEKKQYPRTPEESFPKTTDNGKG
jgi:hypothetical protein